MSKTDEKNFKAEKKVFVTKFSEFHCDFVTERFGVYLWIYGNDLTSFVTLPLLSQVEKKAVKRFELNNKVIVSQKDNKGEPFNVFDPNMIEYIWITKPLYGFKEEVVDRFGKIISNAYYYPLKKEIKVRVPSKRMIYYAKEFFDDKIAILISIENFETQFLENSEDGKTANVYIQGMSIEDVPKEFKVENSESLKGFLKATVSKRDMYLVAKNPGNYFKKKSWENVSKKEVRIV
ncbi:MAG: hypothetical protein RSE00_02705 [Clostridia bacterium]